MVRDNKDIYSLTPRQKKILEILIQEFVKTGEPVSSSAVCENYSLNCSSATIRNEMSLLEDMGFLGQPHAASGRIPLDKAYRMFVDEIIRNKIEPPSRETAQTIEREYQEIKQRLEALLETTVSLLTNITNYTSMLLTPQLKNALFKHIKLVSIDPWTVLLFLLASTGEIINKTLKIEASASQEELDTIAAEISEKMYGSPMEKLQEIIKEIRIDNTAEILSHIEKESTRFIENPSGEVIFKGTSHLLDLPESKDVKNIKMMMELLEEEKEIARILAQTLKIGEISISIGSENKIDEMKDYSLITAAYRIKEKPVGTLGIIGPKRMPYRQIISIINYTAENIGHRLDSLDSL